MTSCRTRPPGAGAFSTVNRSTTPVAKSAAAHAWNWLMRRTFGITVRDVDCAFKLADGPALRTLELRSDGAMISTEIYALAARAGWNVAEVGVHHRPRTAGEPDPVAA